MHFPSRFKRLKHTSGPLLCALSIGLLMAACGSEAPAPGSSGGMPPATVISATVATQPWVDQIEALGTAQASESVTLTAKVTETVDAVKFEDGDRVAAGDILVDLSGRAEVANLEEAQATFKEAQQQYERLVGLVENGTVPRSQLDSQIAARDAARARVETIRARLADRVITAPFAGVLGFRQVSPGTLVTPGTPIATLDDISVIKLDFAVPETFLSAVAAGQTVRARSAAYPGQEFTGVVATVGSRVDPVSRAVMVRADFENPQLLLRPGMLLTVRVEKPAREAIVIPELALLQVGSQSFVYRVGAEGAVERANVRAGARRRGEVEIVEGLAVGERIVVEGTVKLRPGVRVVEAAAATAAAPAG
ncbi:efflux RND transporter periplasmic adaptor subunit [Aquimonas voraii]|uniref:Membrane fusion protein, multidrug efflux system n=1 Tax=Aquimonas voraii TaxID=265719 RepID=A0A1G6VNY2_9GAMM|nr:efflux RND transporter periplasmic adaptor subunit [Aquimonas voraii]SDD54536.1 membrane fusion protein, multidrug efflux system [Aquimonas voraii]